MNPAPDDSGRAMRQLTWALGVAGLLPFFGNALFAWVVPPDEAEGVLRSQAQYAAAILTFLGALHWGVVLSADRPFAPRDGLRLVWGVIPSIFCWIVTLYPAWISIPLLFFALPVVLAADLRLYRFAPMPAWFLPMRIVLTSGATVCVGASWLAMSTRLTP
ncbi:MAG: hypothetical protein RIS35_37 [Pseudomonadota bacterium]|jgi:hypothetical protein